jgi:hypothetical protein
MPSTEDTFKALKRTPYEQMVPLVNFDLNSFQEKENIEFFKRHGWHWYDFYEEVVRRRLGFK